MVGRGFVGLLISTDPFGEVSSAELPPDSLPDGDVRLLLLMPVPPSLLDALIAAKLPVDPGVLRGGFLLPDLGVGVPPPSAVGDAPLRL